MDNLKREQVTKGELRICIIAIGGAGLNFLNHIDDGRSLDFDIWGIDIDSKKKYSA